MSEMESLAWNEKFNTKYRDFLENLSVRLSDEISELHLFSLIDQRVYSHIVPQDKINPGSIKLTSTKDCSRTVPFYCLSFTASGNIPYQLVFTGYGTEQGLNIDEYVWHACEMRDLILRM